MAKGSDIRVVELFAGVGGFRIGLEGASDFYKTIWNNQWEPSTKHQDASLVYRARFGSKGHSNQDINTVPTSDIPDHDLLVGGFPCQDYSDQQRREPKNARASAGPSVAWRKASPAPEPSIVLPPTRSPYTVPSVFT